MKNLLLFSFILLFGTASCLAQQREERMLDHFTKIKAGSSFDVFISKGSQEKVVIEAKSGPIDKIMTEVSGNTLDIYVDNQKWFNSYNFRGVNVYVTFKELESISGSGSGNVRLQSPLTARDLNIASSGSGNMYIEKPLESESDIRISNSGSGSCRIESVASAEDKMDIRNSGSGGVTIERLHADELSVHNSGSGSMHINDGDVNHQFIGLSGSGSYHAGDLMSNTCDVRKSGSGSVHLYVKDELTGNSSGSGNVYLKGTSARLNFHSSGSGKIKHVD